MPPKNNTLRRLFYHYYAVLGNISEAARRSGISSEDALEISRSKAFERAADRSIKPPSAELVLAGLERLAFGSANDAVKLMFSPDISVEELAELDIFNISEINRDKSGGVQIKLFDRQKALEKLWECAKSRNEKEAAAKLFDALKGGDEPEAD